MLKKSFSVKSHFSFIALLLLPLSYQAQETTSSDELFIEARASAFEKKDYPNAIAIAKKALEQSPNYTDISVFLGRLYTWNDQIEEARLVFKSLNDRNVEDEDFFLAYASLEYWNDQNDNALEIVNKGIGYHPQSENLLLLKAKILSAKNWYKESEEVINELLKINPQNTEARALASRIRELSAKNAISINYNYTHFDKQFADDWHIVSLSYKRNTSIGSVIVKGNYANKFNDNGTQIEVEAYPKISKMFYLYVGAGYSNHVGIFPKFRSGLSLNANLPKSFEAEIGFRHLYFSNNLVMYTASLGKYYKNFLFGIKTFITPDSKNISQSYTASVRYYTKGAQDYFAFQIGTGISPEDHLSNLLQTETFKLKTFKLGAEYNLSINKTNFFSISGMYYNQEYRPNTKGNQYDLSLGYTKRF